MAKTLRPDRDCRWRDIAEHTLTLHGDAYGEIQLVAKRVLATPDTMHSPSGVGFDVTVTGSGKHGHFESGKYHSHHGYYGWLEDERAKLARLRAGSVDQVWIDMLGFKLGLYQLDSGTTVVEGFVSDLVYSKKYPWPEPYGKITDQMLDHESFMTCYRFAFRTSLVDPPYVDNFIHDFDALIAHLQLYAPK